MKDHLKSPERVIELFRCAYNIYTELTSEDKEKVDKFLEENSGGNIHA